MWPCLFADRCALHSQPRRVVLAAAAHSARKCHGTPHCVKHGMIARKWRAIIPFGGSLAHLYRYLCCNADMTAHMLGPLTRC